MADGEVEITHTVEIKNVGGEIVSTETNTQLIPIEELQAVVKKTLAYGEGGYGELSL